MPDAANSSITLGANTGISSVVPNVLVDVDKVENVNTEIIQSLVNQCALLTEQLQAVTDFVHGFHIAAGNALQGEVSAGGIFLKVDEEFFGNNGIEAEGTEALYKALTLREYVLNDETNEFELVAPGSETGDYSDTTKRKLIPTWDYIRPIEFKVIAQ